MDQQTAKIKQLIAKHNERVAAALKDLEEEAFMMLADYREEQMQIEAIKASVRNNA